MSTVTEFDSSGEAYDASNCDDSLAILHVPSERAVALAWAWPFAVTLGETNFHAVSSEAGIGRVLADAKIAPATALAAIELAREHGYPICPKWSSWAAGQAN